MAERRPRCVPVRTRDTRTANTAVLICQYILLTNIYIYEDDLQLGKLRRIRRESETFFWGSETFF